MSKNYYILINRAGQAPQKFFSDINEARFEFLKRIEEIPDNDDLVGFGIVLSERRTYYAFDRELGHLRNVNWGEIKSGNPTDWDWYDVDEHLVEAL